MHRRSFLLGLLALTGCGSASPTATRTRRTVSDTGCSIGARATAAPPETATAVAMQRLAEYNQAMQRWSQVNVVNYRITVNMSSFAGYKPETVEVMNGAVVNTAATRSPFRFVTVPDLFGIARREIGDSTRTIITLKYNLMYGYPMMIDSDTALCVTDSSHSYWVTAFTPLP